MDLSKENKSTGPLLHREIIIGPTFNASWNSKTLSLTTRSSPRSALPPRVAVFFPLRQLVEHHPSIVEGSNSISLNPTYDPNKTEVDAWDKLEHEARQSLVQRLEDLTFLEVRSKTTVHEMWSCITERFTALSSHVIASMEAAFNAVQCAPKGNVRTHLEELKPKHLELMQVGLTVLDSHSAKAALLAADLALQSAVSATAAGSVSAGPTAGVMSISITSGTSATCNAAIFDPVYLMQLAIEEFDSKEAELARKGLVGGCSEREDTGVALSAQFSAQLLSRNDAGGRSGKGKGLQRPKGVFWNRGGKGHVKSKCPSPKLKSGEKAQETRVPVMRMSSRMTGMSAAAGTASFLDSEDVFESWDAIPELTLQSASSGPSSESVG
ncbi:unnamed protein product [Mycena citricolor]|uniref:Uncharacterized protein n=1 Tax=Mycena citricolor TaxID=2018698 RepID=A0AAD2HC16_9AGAR|nr:unnamed protein product [Mycena citricolor]